MPIRLDERLSLIASLVEGRVAADIGCDHGKLGYFLVSCDKVDKVICTDISAGSLKKAEELAFEGGVSERMPTRLGDGLDTLSNGEADTVIIAGLGGDSISAILEAARKDGKDFEHYVLSPNTHAEKVRRELSKCGHRIVFDRLVEAGGKRYAVIKTEKGQNELDELQIAFGTFYSEDAVALAVIREELEFKKALYEAHPESKELADKIALLERAVKGD